MALKEIQDLEEKAKKESERKAEATDLLVETLRREAAEGLLWLNSFTHFSRVTNRID